MSCENSDKRLDSSSEVWYPYLQYDKLLSGEINMANIVNERNGYYTTGSEQKPLIISKTLLDAMSSGKVYPMFAPDSTWQSVKVGCSSTVVLSPDNSKVKRHAKRRATKAVSYGKSTVASCPFAGSCVRFCYQNLNNYIGSMRMHAHNYYVVYGKKADELYTIFNAAVKALAKSVTIVRLNDNGDFISVDEILAWARVASDNEHMVFYGYTKNTPHLYKARQAYGRLPENFRISISDLNENDPTSEKYQHIIRSDFPGEFRVVRIIDTPERDRLYADLPWNDEEIMAYDYTSDFKIALHCSTNQFELLTDDELITVKKYKAGSDSNGTKYC